MHRRPSIPHLALANVWRAIVDVPNSYGFEGGLSLYSCEHCSAQFNDADWFNAQLHGTTCTMKKARQVENRYLATVENFWE